MASRPTSPVDVCNLALDELKQSPIKSISTPVSPTEQICARRYDAVRQEALMAHPWKFAIKRTTLTPNVVAPDFGYAYAYDQPNDYIRLVTIGDDYLGDISRDFQVENGQFLLPTGTPTGTTTDPLTLYIRYIYDIQEVVKFSPLFISYLVLKLALRMSNKFAISSSLKASIKDDFKDVEIEARAVNGQERKPIRIQKSRLLTKRRGLPGSIWASKYTIFDN